MSSTSERGARNKGRRWPLSLAIALALILSLGAWASFHAWRSERESLSHYAETTGLESRHPQAVQEILREPDPIAARLRFARLLLADELDLRWLAKLSPSERQAEFKKSLERLVLAEKIARETLSQRPSSWEAAMILGGSVYLTGRRKADPEIYYDRSTWEKPLLAAHRLAPAQPEPLRFLAAALLDSWFSLSNQERVDATKWIRDSFQDPDTFALLAPSWLAHAPSFAAALELVPDRLRAWYEVRHYLLTQRSWAELAQAHEREQKLLPRLLGNIVAEADRHQDGGDLEEARALYLQALNQAMPSKSALATAQEAIRRLPPGPVPAPALPGLSRWLDWALELCLIGPCPLSTAALGRLANAVSGQLRPERMALALVAAGELPQARIIEIHKGELWSAEWGPYLMLKARLLASRGDATEAETALREVNWSWNEGVLLPWNQLLVARTLHDEQGTRLARTKLAAQAASRWPATTWSWKRGTATTLLWPSKTAETIYVHIDQTPVSGGVMIVQWDGRDAGAYPVLKARWINVPARVTTGELHRLTLLSSSVDGPRFQPGEIRLEAPPPSELGPRARRRAAPRR